MSAELLSWVTPPTTRGPIKTIPRAPTERVRLILISTAPFHPCYGDRLLALNSLTPPKRGSLRSERESQPSSRCGNRCPPHASLEAGPASPRNRLRKSFPPC